MSVYLCGGQSEERSHFNVSFEWRFHELQEHYAEATTLLHLQGTLILDLQVSNKFSSTFIVLGIEKVEPNIWFQENIFPRTDGHCVQWLLTLLPFMFLFRTNSII